ncbi:MAG: hypothetical protein L3J47_09125 [Sulfurovum sp.]|nr:hypothetical protein [Sulfurovum sp.]
MERLEIEYKYNRKSLRLKHYDYSREGYYFITVTTQNREHLFGEIVDGKMVLNVAGKMVNELWYDIPNDFNHVVLYDFVIMPNHIHGIIEITKYDKPVGADMESKQRADMESAPTLSTILQSFKRHTTLRYIQMVKNNTLPPFQKRIWQRNFYEHVIRDETDYARIAEYIQNNPLTWENDTLNNP